ncbi:glycine cleavage system aminomethyltransferase GcvT [soil metagenome]
MIDFAGWLMPVQYTGIVDEHHAVRNAAGLFDLGHMGQVIVDGADALAYLQYITTNDVSRLSPGDAQYSMMLYPHGGVVDDIIVYRRPTGPGYFVVINAANMDKDVSWMIEHAEQRTDLDVSVDHVSDDYGMIALQGPNAEAIAGELSSVDLSDMDAFSCRDAEVAGVPCLAARTGYTGEDGWEFYCPIDRVGELWDAILDAGQKHDIQPIGLGARDTLRLEARMPLYGNEISDTINPLEAGLRWVVKLKKGDFIGCDALVAAREAGVQRTTVGFKLAERGGVPRSHYDVQVDGESVGFVTSGTASPTLGENIGLAVIDKDYAGVGKTLDVVIRNRSVRAEQVKLPFYSRG